MFEKATRMKLRFPCKGQGASVEDLWDLSLTGLDGVYKELRGKQKTLEQDSLLDAKTTANDTVSLAIDIVKHIVTVKQDEADARKNASEKAAQRQKIAGILADKKDEALKSMSVEELQKHLESLQ
jgi:hypothetical protein